MSTKEKTVKRPTGLRALKKVEYNVQKLSDQSVVVPKAPTKKKAATPKKAAKKVKKSGATYLVLIKRALKDVPAPGWGLQSIVNYLAANYDRNDRRHIRLALTSGVDSKLFVKTRGSWRLSKKTQDKMTRSDPKKKKKATKKATTTKKTGTKKTGTKKAGTKKTTKKATTKKTGTKKTATKKTATKKTTKKASTKKEKPAKKEATTKVSKKRAAREDDDSAATKSPKKKVIGPPTSDASGPVLEAIGKWQYYDGGWHDYTDDGSRIVEGVYQEYNVNRDIHVRPVQSGHFSYSVNFHSLEQTNTQTGTMRKIRRI